VVGQRGATKRHGAQSMAARHDGVALFLHAEQPSRPTRIIRSSRPKEESSWKSTGLKNCARPTRYQPPFTCIRPKSWAEWPANY